jgi:hypothetical protein
MAAISLLRAASLWLMYLTVEPFVRRAWPRMLISWNRAVRGQFRDPLIGREIVVGCIAGAVTTSVLHLQFPVALAFGIPGLPQNPLMQPSVNSVAGVLGAPMYSFGFSIMAGFVALTLIVLFKIVLRNYWVAFALAWILMSLVSARPPLLAAILAFAAYTIPFYVMHRFGLFAFVTTFFFRMALVRVPLTLDPGAWYAPRSAIVLLLLLAIVIYGFRIALAGKPLFGKPLEEAPAV